MTDAGDGDAHIVRDSDGSLVDDVFTVAVDVHPPAAVAIYAVMETELDTLQRASSEENESSAFFFGSGGALVGTIGSWISFASLPVWGISVLTSVTMVLAIATIFFGVRYARAKRASTEVVARIKRRETTPYRLTAQMPRTN